MINFFYQFRQYYAQYHSLEVYFIISVSVYTVLYSISFSRVFFWYPCIITLTYHERYTINSVGIFVAAWDSSFSTTELYTRKLQCNIYIPFVYCILLSCENFMIDKHANIEQRMAVANTIINSLWPCDAIWQHKSGPTLTQVMACCLTAASQYLTQCRLIISKVQWHSSEKFHKRYLGHH